MWFYNFNFKGRWNEFKYYFPKRLNSFKFIFSERFLVNNGGFLNILMSCLYQFSILVIVTWFDFILEYRLVWIAFIRKRGSYSRVTFFEGFDTTKVISINPSAFNFLKERRSEVKGIVSENGLGFNSFLRSRLERGVSRTNIFALDLLCICEEIILKHAHWRAYHTYVYITRRFGSFFLLTASPWPFFAGMSAFCLLVGMSGFFSYYEGGLSLMYLGLVLIAFVFFAWCRDFVRELNSFHRVSNLILDNVKLGFWLFIVSEAFLFVSFFWAFFHMALEPAFQIGAIWPPVEGIQMDSLFVPTINTLFLLASGASFTWVQYHLVAKLYNQVLWGFVVTLIFSFFFLMCQWHEYVVSAHQLNDAVFGSTLYMLTAFHGAHVLIGTIFIIVCFLRFLTRQFGWTEPMGVTLAAWYWHFVDVVWLIVFVWIYLWGTWIPKELDVIFQMGFSS